MLRISALLFALLTLAAPVAADYPAEPPGEAELLALRDRIEAGETEAAIGRLDILLAETPDNADILSLLGFAMRKAGRMDCARGYYDRALARDPAHPGALEYLGEMEVGLGRLDAARALEARLEAACPGGCEPLEDLRAAIAAAAR